MKRILLVFSAITLLLSCDSCNPEPTVKHLTYQNIVILSDLSSRIANARFPQKDNNEIHKIIEYFKSECVKPGEKIGDRSSLSFSNLSKKTAICIDLDTIKDLGDKQSFINSTNKYKNSGLKYKLADFEDTVKSHYLKMTDPGLDLISLLIEKIDNEDIVKQQRTITDDIETTFINYENHIYIFTDGYLEYASSVKKKNGQFYFGSSEIEKVRKYCMDNNLDIKTALDREKSLGLPPFKNVKNRHIHLHILETHERDKDTRLNTYLHNKGSRDNEILEAVWCKWAKESGFKGLEWKKY